MRRLTLSEFTPVRAVPLSDVERDSLRRLHPGIRLEPTSGAHGKYDLTADQRIGLVCLPTLVVEIRPKVPIAAVVFLLSYVADALTWSEHMPEFAPDADIAELVALMLARMVEQTTRRGLLSGYQTEEEALQSPRGRILFDEQFRRRFGHAPPIEVRHDVFTADILENRLLVGALSALSRVAVRAPAARGELSRAQRLFGSVRRVHFRPSAVPDVLFTRLNRHYEASVSLARMVLQSASVDLGTGGARGAAFLIDMNVAFERFVRRALRRSLGASLEAFPDRAPKARLDVAGVVPLRPDLSLVRRGRIVWVGDAKYKRLPAGAYRNADLYQLLAYAVALRLPGGLLIYAADEGVKNAEHEVVHSGKRLRVEALDLTAPPSAVLRQVDGLAARIAAEALPSVAARSAS